MRSDRTLDDLADELESILEQTIRTRLISDVPLGAFLSSGVDSSTIVAIIAKKLQRPIKTFTMGFIGSATSEHPAAQAMADHLGVEHHSHLTGYDAVNLGRHIGKNLDEPHGDGSCLPTFLLSEYTRRHVTVALSGDGGDEMFGGYRRYLYMMSKEAEANASPLSDWNPGDDYYRNALLLMKKPALNTLIGPLPIGIDQWLTEQSSWINRDPRPLINKMREIDTSHYLPGDVLAKVDRMSMQHSLEIRSPLLGRGVADFAMRLAANSCYEHGQGKLVLKCLAERFIPRDWLERPKRGFSLAAADWDCASLVAVVREALFGSEGRLRQWIDESRLRAFCDFQAAKPTPNHLWMLYVLEIWLQHHVATSSDSLRLSS
jgi:asparagine synthase (glutamine-hydrolysing)